MKQPPRCLLDGGPTKPSTLQTNHRLSSHYDRALRLFLGTITKLREMSDSSLSIRAACFDVTCLRLKIASGLLKPMGLVSPAPSKLPQARCCYPYLGGSISTWDPRYNVLF